MEFGGELLDLVGLGFNGFLQGGNGFAQAGEDFCLVVRVGWFMFGADAADFVHGNTYGLKDHERVIKTGGF